MKYERNTIPIPKKVISRGVEEAIKEMAPALPRKAHPENQKNDSPPVNEIPPQRNLSEAKRLLSEKLNLGALDRSVVDTIFDQSGFLPIEGALIDYKRDLPKSTAEYLKTIKHIQAFHNTYGGYLIFGAEEIEKDSIIIPKYCFIDEIDAKKLRDLCRENFTSPIEIQAQKFSLKFKGEDREVAVIQIPKRGATEPVACKKDGAYEGKNIFTRESHFIRDGDNTVTVSSPPHWKLLYGNRINPFMSINSSTGPIKLLQNNLPDRSFICQKFIGRHEVLEKLFNWLSDDFSCVRVLAGEGGLGKTSVAFEFAYDVAREHLGNAEAVLWFTAKKYQFRALENQFEQVAMASFSNSSELFRVIASELGATPEEIEETPDEKLPKFLKGLTNTIPSFIVIDDLDSLEINEQKRSIEVCQQLAGSGSRFLFTIRKNATASSSTAIEIQGLTAEDYAELIESWEKRLGLTNFPEKQVERLRDASQGSPLYTESLLRLIKSGISTADAIAKWKGNLGIEVRNAALKREVVQLSAEAKKVLITAAILSECSFAEIKNTTGFSDVTLTDCVNELQSLFLISAPSIADQPRFKVSNTTRDLVVSLGPELIPGFSSYSDGIKNQRYKPKNQRANSQLVGAAINQAMALISAGNPVEALKTINEVIAELGGNHPDLLFMRARALSKLGEPKRIECRKAFKSAHECGQRKLKFFQLWYEVESEAHFYETAIEVCSSAIEAGAGEKADWLINRSHSRILSAAAQHKREDWEHVRTQLKSAAEDLHQAQREDPDLIWNPTWQEYLYQTHDSLWNLDRRLAHSIPELLVSLDNQLAAIERGDLRYQLFTRLPVVLQEIESTFLKDGKEMTTREFNLLQKSARSCKFIFTKAPNNLKTLRPFENAARTVAQFSKNYRVQ